MSGHMKSHSVPRLQRLLLKRLSLLLCVGQSMPQMPSRKGVTQSRTASSPDTREAGKRRAARAASHVGVRPRKYCPCRLQMGGKKKGGSKPGAGGEEKAGSSPEVRDIGMQTRGLG